MLLPLCLGRGRGFRLRTCICEALDETENGTTDGAVPTVCTVEDIREPDEHIFRLNPAAEIMYWIQLGSDFNARMWAKESELEMTE